MTKFRVFCNKKKPRTLVNRPQELLEIWQWYFANMTITERKKPIPITNITIATNLATLAKTAPSQIRDWIGYNIFVEIMGQRVDCKRLATKTTIDHVCRLKAICKCQIEFIKLLKTTTIPTLNLSSQGLLEPYSWLKISNCRDLIQLDFWTCMHLDICITIDGFLPIYVPRASIL